MAGTRELSTINVSGELSSIQLGGIAAKKKVVIKEELQIVADNVAAESQRTHGISYTPGVPTSPNENLKHDHLGFAVGAVLEGTQTLPTDPAVIATDNRLITIKNAYLIEQALKTFIDQHFMPLLDEHNPSMRMDVSPTGAAAQMSVHDVEKNRLVATMEWVKSTQTFSFALMDRNTGVVKNALDLYLNGTAKLHNKNILTEHFATMEAAYTASGDHDLITVKDLREFRSTVVSPIAGSNPTKAECSTAAQTLPHWNWSKDDDFYIKDNNGTKYFLVKYRSNGDTSVGGNNYKFYYEKLTEAS